jgi:hypothetical protein
MVSMTVRRSHRERKEEAGRGESALKEDNLK